MDLVLMDERARLRAPFAELGVPPEAASSWLLPERMGWQRASAMLLASEWIDAGQAVEAGLALRVCPEGTVLAETLDVARRIASFAPHATREVKRLMMAPRLHQIAEARAREEAAFAALFADPDINPGAQLIAGLDG
jgi:enoyl-CoA hydratase/carnithine racemase